MLKSRRKFFKNSSYCRSTSLNLNFNSVFDNTSGQNTGSLGTTWVKKPQYFI